MKTRHVTIFNRARNNPALTKHLDLNLCWLASGTSRGKDSNCCSLTASSYSHWALFAYQRQEFEDEISRLINEG